MTKEELIKHLEHLAEYVKYSEDAPALREVIKALTEEHTQERTETHACDCVSRQAAIEVIDAVFPVDPMKSEYSQGIACGAALAKTYVEQLPSAQPETHDKRTETHACDLISRQDAIDALDVLCQEHRYKIPGKRETYSQYSEAWQDALDRAEGAIFNLPSAQPEIVRCKNCKHHHYDKNIPYCDRIDYGYGWKDDDYCSRAERRADE